MAGGLGVAAHPISGAAIRRSARYGCGLGVENHFSYRAMLRSIASATCFVSRVHLRGAEARVTDEGILLWPAIRFLATLA